MQVLEKKNTATFENMARFSPSKSKDFITDLCSSSLESLIMKYFLRSF